MRGYWKSVSRGGSAQGGSANVLLPGCYYLDGQGAGILPEAEQTVTINLAWDIADSGQFTENGRTYNYRLYKAPIDYTYNYFRESAYIYENGVLRPNTNHELPTPWRLIADLYAIWMDPWWYGTTYHIPAELLQYRGTTSVVMKLNGRYASMSSNGGIITTQPVSDQISSYGCRWVTYATMDVVRPGDAYFSSPPSATGYFKYIIPIVSAQIYNGTQMVDGCRRATVNFPLYLSNESYGRGAAFPIKTSTVQNNAIRTYCLHGYIMPVI